MRSLILFALLVLVMPAALQAHRQNTILTTVQYNPRTERMEVIHQIYAHDVEHAFGNQVQAEGGLDNIRAQALVSLALSRSFQIWDDAGVEISLDLVGAELEAEFFYLYQEAAISAIPDHLRVRHDMLRAYWPDMQNYLNVDYGDFVGSLIFRDDDGIKSLQRE